MHGVLRSREGRDRLFSALKCVNLVASLLSVLLTRIVITSYVGPDTSLSNARFGILMGLGSVAFGLYVVLRFRCARNA